MAKCSNDKVKTVLMRTMGWADNMDGADLLLNLYLLNKERQMEQNK